MSEAMDWTVRSSNLYRRPRFGLKPGDSFRTEQPDPRRLDPYRLHRELAPRLGFFPHSLLDRSQLLILSLLIAALFDPLLTTIDPPPLILLRCQPVKRVSARNYQLASWPVSVQRPPQGRDWVQMAGAPPDMARVPTARPRPGSAPATCAAPAGSIQRPAWGIRH